MQESDLIKKSIDMGAYKAAVIDTKDIVFDKNLIKSCESNQCGNYNRNWACPPCVGDTDLLIEKAKSYQKALVVQTVWKIEDSFDIEGMFGANENHKKIAFGIFDFIKTTISDVLFLNAGGCTVCPECSKIDDQPCRYPERAFASLEAYGVFVYELANVCGMKYINGQNTVTYFSAYFFNEKE